jgi:hypothetical protein
MCIGYYLDKLFITMHAPNDGFFFKLRWHTVYGVWLSRNSSNKTNMGIQQLGKKRWRGHIPRARETGCVFHC